MVKNSTKFVSFDRARLYECHWYIIGVTKTRTGLISALAAAKRSLETPLLYAQLVTFANAVQKELVARGVIVL